MISEFEYRSHKIGGYHIKYIQWPSEHPKPATFHPFSRLPTELRLKIWKHALPAPRVLRIDTPANFFEPMPIGADSDFEWSLHPNYKSANDAHLQTCQESGAVFREHYQKIERIPVRGSGPTDFTTSAVYSNFKEDTLALDVSTVISAESQGYFWDLTKIQNLLLLDYSNTLDFVYDVAPNIIGDVLPIWAFIGAICPRLKSLILDPACIGVYHRFQHIVSKNAPIFYINSSRDILHAEMYEYDEDPDMFNDWRSLFVEKAEVMEATLTFADDIRKKFAVAVADDEYSNWKNLDFKVGMCGFKLRKPRLGRPDFTERPQWLVPAGSIEDDKLVYYTFRREKEVEQHLWCPGLGFVLRVDMDGELLNFYHGIEELFEEMMASVSASTMALRSLSRNWKFQGVIRDKAFSLWVFSTHIAKEIPEK